MSRTPRSRAGGRAGRSRGRPRPARTRDPEDKRARVMDAARRLFSERGYVSTTTADVARRAGVSEGIIFHHFGSKAQLLAAVADDYGRGVVDAMFAAAPPPGAAPTVEAMLRRAFEYTRKHGALARLLSVSADPQADSAARRATRDRIVGALAQGLAAWQGSGLVRAMDPRIVAELLFSLVESALAACFVYGAGDREEDYLREAVRCVEGAIAPRADDVTDPHPTRSRPT